MQEEINEVLVRGDVGEGCEERQEVEKLEKRGEGSARGENEGLLEEVLCSCFLKSSSFTLSFLLYPQTNNHRLDV